METLSECIDYSTTPQQECSCAKSFFGDPLNGGAKISYITLYYCELSDHKIFSICWMFFWLIFLVYVLVSTASGYFCPTLAKAAERLRISSSIAGVILLAIGNGSPDVFAAVVAVIHGASDMAFGALLGAGLFVSSLVVGVIFLSFNVQVSRRPFVRDVLFYICILLLLFLILYDGAIELWESLGFICLYLVYILLAMFARFFYQRSMKKKREALGIVEDAPPELLKYQSPEDEAGYPMLDEAVYIGKLSPWAVPASSRSHGELMFGLDDWSCSAFFRHIFSQLNLMTGWQERSLPNKIFYLILSPLTLARNLTIPLVEGDQWQKIFAVLNPIFLPQFILFVISPDFLVAIDLWGFELPIWSALLVIGVILSIVIWKTTNAWEPPSYAWLFVLTSFVASAIWMYQLATEIVFVLRILGLITTISEVVLGSTAIAWGNSIVDLVTNVIVSKQGFSGMALGACFGAPAFNLLAGLGIAVTVRNIIFYPEPLKVSLGVHLISVYIFLAIGLISTVIFLPIFKFRMLAHFGVFLVLLYVCYAACAVLIEMRLFDLLGALFD